jgi:alcohol dehydrogenase (cytochrome c)
VHRRSWPATSCSAAPRAAISRSRARSTRSTPTPASRSWTFDVIKNDPKSWPGESGKVGGGSAWMPGTYDAKSDTIYIGTSNAAPDYYNYDRKGDNLYTATLLALDPKTGKLKWHRQEVPNDSWDYDAAYEALIVQKDGKDVIVHLNKGGFVFVMDKKDGKLENVWQFAENVNWVKGVDPKTGALIDPVYPEVDKVKTFCPNLLGARSWNHGAYNPGTGLWYSHAMEVCNEVVAGKDDPDNLKAVSALSLGIESIKLVSPPNSKPHGRLDARDPLTGKRKWTIRYDMPPLSSVLTTAGGLVFTGDMEGNVFAYDAETARSSGSSPPAPACAAARSAIRSRASSTSWCRPASVRTHRASCRVPSRRSRICRAAQH